MKRNFEGVWLPRELYLRDDVSWPEKLILVEVRSFTHNDLPCFVSNEHLAHHCQVSISTIEKSIARLVKEGFLTRTRKQHNGRSTRFLTINTRKIGDLQPVKSAESHPYFLRTEKNKITEQTKKPKKERTPSNIEDVKKAFLAVGSNATEAHKFFDYYEANGWTQGKGKPIVDWHAAARGWINRTKQWGNHPTGFNAERIDRTNLADYLKNGTAQNNT